MKIKATLTSFCFILLAHLAWSQLTLNPLSHNPWIEQEYKERAKNIDPDKAAVMVNIPFFDDFSQDHFPGNSEGNEVLWENNQVYRNNSYAINAPSIGVATFDGLNEVGYPHNDFDGIAYGSADTLTSVEIDLSDTEGNIKLSFFVQGGGMGDAPEVQDSLVLEFLNTTSGEWERQWSSPGISSPTFDAIILPVEGEDFLQNNFQFRFRNYGTLNGGYDQWNIDYVYMNQNRQLDDTVPNDVAFVKPIFSFLNNGYVSMPWKHYQIDPSSNMMATEQVLIRNHRDVSNTLEETKVKVEYENATQIEFVDDLVPPLFAQSDTPIDLEINSSPNDYFYNPNVDDTEATFDVEVSLQTSPNDFEDNDQMQFEQVFLDYYDYSDGIGESNLGFGDFFGVGSIAFRIDAVVADSLEAIQYAFMPAGADAQEVLIAVSIWDDDGPDGGPGTILYQSEEPENPFYADGPNGFHTYFLEETVEVDEHYYIGWKQFSGDIVTVGNDLSRDINGGRLYYETSETLDWIPASLPGALMMRPQYVSDIISSVEELIPADEINLYPNPTDHFLHLGGLDKYEYDRVYIFDQKGNMLIDTQIPVDRVDVSTLNNGIYWVAVIGENKTLKYSERFVISK